MILHLNLTSDGWTVTHYAQGRDDGPRIREIVDLFGTTTLPTPFTAAAPVDRVRAELERLNPLDTVTV